MVSAADDVRDAHINVVSDDAEVISGNSVGTQQDEVFQLGIRKFDVAEDRVRNNCDAGFGNGESQGARIACSAAPFDLFCRDPAADAFVLWSAALGLSARAASFQFLFRTKAVVSVSGLQKFFRGSLVKRQ